MSSLTGYGLCWTLLEEPDLEVLQESGLKADMVRGDAQVVFQFIVDHYRTHGRMPERNTVLDDCDVHPDVVDIDPPEPCLYYAQKIVKQAALRAQRDHVKDMGEALRDRDPEGVYESAKELIRESVWHHHLGTGRIVNLKNTGQKEWEEYEHRKGADGGIVGIRSPWERLDQETLGWQAGMLTTIVARLGVGKCVAEGTRVTDGRTGLRVPIEEAVRDKLDVLTFDQEDPRVRPVTPDAWINTGRKGCLRVTTRLGEEIVVTPEHPFLTSAGWVRADELEPGSMVTAVARVPEPTEPISRCLDEVRLLAVLLSEGSYSGNHVSFSSADEDYVSFVKNVGERLGFSIRQTNHYDYAITGHVRKRLLRKYGLGRERAKEKRIPDEVFRIPNDQLREFLRVFWWGDGGVTGEVGLASEGLIDDLKHLLLRFGIVTRKSYKTSSCRGKQFDSWRLRVEAWTRGRLLELVGDIPGDKGAAIREAVTEPVNPNTDNVHVTDELLASFKAAAESYRQWDCSPGERKGLFVEAAKRLGVQTPRQYGLREFGRKNGKQTAGRRAIGALIDEAGELLAEHQWLVSEDIVFDTVVDIEPVGERQVYDLTVSGTHAFVAEHLVVHNTWLLLIIACFIEEQGYSVGFVSLEMEESAIRIRRRAIKERISYKDYKRGELDSETEERIKEILLAEPDKDSANFFVASGGRVTTISEAEIFAEETGCDVLMIDGIYLMDEGTKNTPMHERTLLAIRGLKRLGQRKRIPTFATAQFNRNVKKGSMQAGSESIGGSDAIGQDSDNVFGLFRDRDHYEAKQMFFSSLKIREGTPIEMTLDWDFDSMSFRMVDAGIGDDEDEEDDSGVLF